MLKTKYFSEDEMLVSATGERLGIENDLPAALKPAMLNTMQRMDKVREFLGHPVTVLSGYRSPRLNDAVKGSRRSWHCFAQAVDFICPKYGTPYQICQALSKLAGKDKSFVYHEIIHEYGSWVHIAFPVAGQKPDMELLTINKKGTFRGILP